MSNARSSLRVFASATWVFAVALLAGGIFDVESMARFPGETRPFLLASAIAYAAVGVSAWHLAMDTGPDAILTRYRNLLGAALVAYALSFGPLAAAVVPLAGATMMAGESAARSLRRILRAFLSISVVFAGLATVAAVRSEAVFRQRLEGIVLFTCVGLATWHAVAAALAGLQLRALSGFIAQPSTATWEGFASTYRRTLRLAATGMVVMVGLFLLTLAFIHLERASGPPR